MKLRRANRQNHALTLVEVLVIVFVLAVLVAMILPANHSSQRKWIARRIMCVNNLKQIGLAERIWEGNHGDKYPMNVSIINGGAMELATTGNATAVFQVMSNELSTPRILFYPADVGRSYATNFSIGLSAQNISYFIGLDADESNPQTLLSGDDNFEINGIPAKSGLLEFPTSTTIAWSAARHKFFGNIGLADGSVQQLSQSGLRQTLRQTGLATNRLAIP